jgi:Carboxypeptidase regulatory-like domain/TonB-dependent Receptor Plug Domain
MRAIAAVCVAMLGASSVSAQTAGTLTGRVATSEGTPVPGARIRVIGTDLSTVADARGDYRLAGVPTLTQKLDVRMLGYTPIELPFELGDGGAALVNVVLVPIPLEPLEVVERTALTPGLMGFEERAARGPGTFFTREAILRMHARQFTDILRRVPGLQVRQMSGYGNLNIQTRGSNCQVLFYMNGTAFPLPNDVPINQYVSPDEVVGVEVYSGSSEIPAEFNSSKQSRCGVIVIWTRIGPEARRRR